MNIAKAINTMAGKPVIRITGHMTGGVSGLNTIVKGMTKLYGNLVSAGSDAAKEETALNDYLFENNVLPQQICAPSSASKLAADEQCLFTSEDEANAVLKSFDANQHPDIQTWFRPSWKDVPADLPHIIRYEESSGPTQDFVKCTKANHKELSKRRGNALNNIRVSYCISLKDKLAEFDEECISKGLDRNEERANHVVFGKARIGVGADAESILQQEQSQTTRNKPLVKLAKAIKAEQTILVQLVGLGQSGETSDDAPLEELSDDSGARLCEDDIRDKVTVDMIEAFEARREDNKAWEETLAAFDLDPAVQEVLGTYASKIK
jgi:hypothetical protein